MCTDSSAFVDVHTPAHEISIIITEERKKNQLCLLFFSLTPSEFSFGSYDHLVYF